MTEVNIVKVDGKPLEKLIEVIGKAVGTIYKPRAIRKEADARAYEIEVIERAKAAALANSKEVESVALERLENRILHRELKRQKNLDAVSQIAVEQISMEENVSEDPVSEDWTSRFFNIVQDISDEEMQTIWGKILAGEVKKPNSYSLRTLECLRNLSTQEAKIFIKAANLAIISNRRAFIYKPGDEQAIYLTFDELTKLIEAGIMQPGDLIDWRIGACDGEMINGLKISNYTLLIKRPAKSPRMTFPINLFTQTGYELLQLSKGEPPFEYVKSLAKTLKRDNIEVTYVHHSAGTNSHKEERFDFDS